MRSAYEAITSLQDEVLKEVDKKPLSDIRKDSLRTITDQYANLEETYLQAYEEATTSFKHAALKVNKQQLEKQILEKVTSMSNDIESMKDYLQTIGRVLFVSLSADAKAILKAEGLLAPSPVKPPAGDETGTPPAGFPPVPMDVDTCKGEHIR